MITVLSGESELFIELMCVLLLVSKNLSRLSLT